ncbi:MAG: ferritin [Bacteroidia bacterium]|nr:ferritin [Bacteroidia bacterium]
MIKKAVEVALNEQINAEFHSAYLYLSMSAWFHSVGLAGYANWMRIQYQEELAHATRFFDYVNERGGNVKLSPIGEVQVDFKGTVNVFEETLVHEQLVTSLINKLMDIAIKESDHATKSFLQWFVDEQVEEEANVEQILHNLKLIKGEGQGLLMMDREMQTRVFVDPFAGAKA